MWRYNGLLMELRFEQNVCNLLKVRKLQNLASPEQEFSTGFSTGFVEIEKLRGQTDRKERHILLR